MVVSVSTSKVVPVTAASGVLDGGVTTKEPAVAEFQSTIVFLGSATTEISYDPIQFSILEPSIYNISGVKVEVQSSIFVEA